MLERAYRRMGPWYLGVVVGGTLPYSFLAAAGSLLAATIVFGGTTAQFVTLLLPSIVVCVVCIALTVLLSRPIVRPWFDWIRGDRRPDVAVHSWTQLATSPLNVVRRGIVVFTVTFLWAPFVVVWLFQQPMWAAIPVWVGLEVAILWAATLIFLWLETSVRPALSDAAAMLPDDFRPATRSPSTQWKLIVATTIFAASNIAIFGSIAALPFTPPVRISVGVFGGIVASFTVALIGNAFITTSVRRSVEELTRATSRVAAGDLTTRVPLLTSDEFGDLALGFNRMVRGLSERSALQSALASYVDPIIAERLLAEGELLAGEDVDVTLLFLDIRGFTTISERQEPRMIVRYLNVFFSRIVPVIMRHGGHVNRFTGDGLLAVFGVPERHADHADRAVNAAREIARTADDLYGASSLLGMGLNSGHVIAGTVGGGGHLEFTVMGDAVNVAARVQEMTRTSGDPILLTAATKSELSSSDDLEHRGTMPIRGRSEPIDVFAVPLRTTTGPDPYGWESWRWDETLFAGAAKHYERGRTPYAPGLADALADALSLDGTGRLLDVGCGPGTIALRLAHLFAEVVGVDADREMIEEAKRLAREQNVGNATWLCMLAEDLPDELGTFDVIAFAASFHWMDRPRVASTVRTMLEPGGVAIQVDAPAYRFETRMIERFPHPVVPQHEIVELRRHYLGPHKRAGRGFRNTSPGGEDAIFQAAGFLPAETIRVPDGRVLEWTSDDVVANVFSSSATAPHLFGDHLERFETDLRAVLERESPSGLFSVSLPANRIHIWRVAAQAPGR